MNFWSRLLLAANSALIRLGMGVFSYQIYVRAIAKPTVEHLLAETIDTSAELKKSMPVEIAA